MTRAIRDFLLISTILMLSGCGFQLRGAYSLPYESIYLATGDSVVGAGLKRQIRASGGTAHCGKGCRCASDVPTDRRYARCRNPFAIQCRAMREKALALPLCLSDRRWQGAQDLVPQGYVELTRDVTYADSTTLAKTQEEDLLWRDMETTSFSS